MKRLVLISLIFLASTGTCRSQINPQYDTYVTFSADANMNVYQTVIVEGTTTGSCTFTYICGPYGQQCTSTIPGCPNSHTPSIYNVIGGVGGWTTGPAYDMYSYMSFQTTSSVHAQPGQVMDASWDGQVYCPIAGIILNGGGSLHIEFAYTRALSLGRQSNCSWNKAITQEVCDIAATPWCTSYTSPPDWPVNTVRSQVFPGPPPSWWEAFDVCVTYGSPGHLQPWSCLPTGIAAEMYTANPPLANCTHNP